MSVFSSLQKANQSEFVKWLEEKIELSNYQKSIIYEDEIFKYGKYKIYKKRKRITNFWIRLTVIFYPFMWLLLFMGLPINFLFTGTWGYGDGKLLKFFRMWSDNIGIR